MLPSRDREHWFSYESHSRPSPVQQFTPVPAGIGNEIFAAVRSSLTDQIVVFDISGAVRRKLTVQGSIGLQSLAGATSYATIQLGVFNNATWFLDVNGDGVFDPAKEHFGWGVSGSTAVPAGWK